MVGRLHQPHAGETLGRGALDHFHHQLAADGLVLHGRVDGDWADAGDRVALIEKVASQDLAAALGHHAPKAGMAQQHGGDANAHFGGGKVPRKAVGAGDFLEGLENDRTAGGGVGAGPFAKDDVHARSPLTSITLNGLLPAKKPG